MLISVYDKILPEFLIVGVILIQEGTKILHISLNSLSKTKDLINCSFLELAIMCPLKESVGYTSTVCFLSLKIIYALIQDILVYSSMGYIVLYTVGIMF